MNWLWSFGRLPSVLSGLNVPVRSISMGSFVRCSNDTQTSEASDFMRQEVIMAVESKVKTISKAMQSYLLQKAGREEFEAKETEEFELGCRHLANIMGADPDNFTQEEIDRAVRYLLPSGLKWKQARPMLKHPKEVFPASIESQFGQDGRPFHPFFYTGKPKFHRILHDAAWNLEHLKAAHDEWLREHGSESSPPGLPIEVQRDQCWIDQSDLARRLNEKISDNDYKRLIALLDAILAHPMGSLVESFLGSLRMPMQKSTGDFEACPLSQDEFGNHFVEARGARKLASAAVRVWLNGSGELTVNGLPMIEYFPGAQEREQLLFPLVVSRQLSKVDVECRVWKEGLSAQAGAIRLALSQALASLPSSQGVIQEKMRIAGLLVLNVRIAERQKPGQKGARRKFTWKKR